jgi:hypothetical protein
MHSCKTPLRVSLRGWGAYTSSSLLREREGRISSQLPQCAQPELLRLRRRNGNSNSNCAEHLRKQVPPTRPPCADVC